MPKLLRLKRFKSGSYCGYWCLRPVDGEGLEQWMLTRHTGQDTQLFAKTGFGYPEGVRALVELLLQERSRVLADLHSTLLKWTADSVNERNHLGQQPRGFRPGFAWSQVARTKQAMVDCVRAWEKNFIALKNLLIEKEWLTVANVDSIVAISEPVTPNAEHSGKG